MGCVLQANPGEAPARQAANFQSAWGLARRKLKIKSKLIIVPGAISAE
jgi:hypothetical protein